MSQTDAFIDSLSPDLEIGPPHRRFRLTAALGRIAYGALWQAADLGVSGHPQVTLLFLPTALTQQPGLVERLRSAVSLSRRIDSPFTLDCYGLFSSDKHYFLSFEALDGYNLQQLLTGKALKKLKESRRKALVIQLGKALHACHQQLRAGLGCLSPELVFIQQGQGVKLMTLGWHHLCADYEHLLLSPPLHHRYQPAEQFTETALTSRSDLFALAALTYELYQGQPPFSDTDDERSRYQRELKKPATIDDTQWQLLSSALAAHADARPANVALFLRGFYLHATEAHEPVDVESLLPEASTTEPAATEPTPANPRTDESDPATPAPPIGRRWQLPAQWLEWFNRQSWVNALWFQRGLIFALGLLLGFLLGLLLSQPRLTHLLEQNQRLGHALREQTLLLDVTLQEQQRLQQALQEHTLSDNSLDDQASSAPDPLGAHSQVPGRRADTSPVIDNNTPDAHPVEPFRDHFNDGHGPAMVVIPAGSFRMGDLSGHGDDNEKPVRQVTIAHPFALSAHEVTFDEYDQFARATGRRLPDDEGWGRGARPVINVSWNDARAYVRWLSQQSGQPYRLPTEAEWEYAARAGTDSLYWWGDTLLPNHAVCDECGTPWDGQQTAPVGQFAANPWGLHDMHGNVDEWVEDCYADDYSGVNSDGSAHLLGDCSYRVMRGGSWFDIGRVIRAASRYRHPANASSNSWGFRVALDLPRETQP